MKTQRVVPFKSLFVFVAQAISLLSPSAHADDGLHFGGYNGSCGNSQNWCLPNAQSFDRTTSSTTGAPIQVHVAINYKYLAPSGSQQPMLFSVDLLVTDPNSYFDLESELPLIAHPQAIGFHRENRYFAQSQTVVLKRIAGTHQFKGYFTFQLTNEFGAEYVEFLRGIDLMVTGATQWVSVGY